MKKGGRSREEGEDGKVEYLLSTILNIKFH